MSKSELGVKTNLVSELLMISYFFIDSLLKKFIFKDGNLCITFIILFVFGHVTSCIIKNIMI